MRDFLAVTKALADRSRVRALLALRERKLCVCQIIEFLGLAPSTVSKHMAVLRQAGLVEDFKEGRWVYYRLPGGPSSRVVRHALAWARKSLEGDPDVRADAKRIKDIVKIRPEDLCRRLSKC